MKKRRLSQINEKIKKWYEWDINRKEKINERQKSIESIKEKQNTYKPTINKKSKKLANIKSQKYVYEIPNKNNNIYERLYKDDVIKRKERQKILNQIYSPTFIPKLFKHNIKNVTRSEKN